MRATSAPTSPDGPLRFIVVREYLIAYAPEEKPCGLWLSCTDGAAPA